VLAEAGQLAAARLYAQRAALIRRLLGNAAVAAYDELDDYGQTELDAYLDRMVPLSLAAQRTMANSLAGYLYAASEEYPDEPWDVDEVTGDAVRPDGLRHGWSVPWFALWGAIGAGVALNEAVAHTRELYRVQGVTDLSFVQAATMRLLGPRLPRLVGYRRVLSGPGCAFCAEASQQVYRQAELMPVHPGCNCAVAAVFAEADPALALNDQTMEVG
jgi:hypothetical protein